MVFSSMINGSTRVFSCDFCESGVSFSWLTLLVCSVLSCLYGYVPLVF